MTSFLHFAPLLAIIGLVLLAACGGGSPTEPPAGTTIIPTFANDGQPVSLTLENHGGSMESHTPGGFQGSGTGLFAGDNLNRNFPDGDGVQIFLAFDLSGMPPGKVESAVLSAANATVIRTPFQDLGPLRAEEFRFDGFSSQLWNVGPVAGGAACTLAEAAGEPITCEISAAVQSSLDDSHRSPSSGSAYTQPATVTASKTWWHSSRAIPTPTSPVSSC
jgi:hypothetical protein